ncbi:MAG: isoprenylcysteine carboxylmethyltransferase family protein [Planctomycetes bacterium]|nr:isoprenylcysteine carboxylmethyltransferase family protein [Planctomycetota bacterium]
MNPWYGKSAVIVSLVVYIIIRAPHGRRSMKVPIAEDRKGGLEIGLLIGAWLGTTIVPVVWITTSLFAVAEYTLHPVPYGVGLGMMVLGLWLFYCSHTDLGTNWSVTLQTREEHSLVTTGIYSRIRHPMYSSMFALGVAQALFLPNWIVGPAYLVSFGLLYVFRVRIEERMMLDRFGTEYEDYVQRTGRLIPRLG